MSVSSVGGFTIPDPGNYSYPSGLPQGLTDPIPPETPSPMAASSSSSPKLSPYKSEFQTLQQEDAAELIQVSLASFSAAQANVSDVLAQAASLQAQAQTAQRQQLLNAADGEIQGTNATTPSTSATDALNLPSLNDVIGQSDQTANAVLAKYSAAAPGSSILDFQA